VQLRRNPKKGKGGFDTFKGILGRYVEMILERRIKDIVAECLSVDPDGVYPDASFESLGADYLDMVGLFISLEEEFGIDISERDANRLKTVKDVTWYIRCILESRALKNMKREGDAHDL